MIKIGIVGYGNLGRGVECAVTNSPDMELAGVFTRRKPETVKTHTNVPVYEMDKLYEMQGQIDVLVLCGGSANDLPTQTVELAQYFNVVDSFDTHAKIPEHFSNVNASSEKGKHISIISVGWDPGLFSLNRLYGQAILPNGQDYTFWGKGVSQGHSDAIRRIAGVKDARQYTIPVEAALESVRKGENPTLSTRQKHTRECFVVAKEDADLKRIEEEIKTMPNYFADYDTTVHFISEEELMRDHQGIDVYKRQTLCQMCQLCQKNGPEAKNHNPKAPDLRSLSISSPVFFTAIHPIITTFLLLTTSMFHNHKSSCSA